MFVLINNPQTALQDRVQDVQAAQHVSTSHMEVQENGSVLKLDLDLEHR